MIGLCVVSVRAGVPEFTLAQLEHRLANGGDTTFVVNFWATWCKPCVAELPAFDYVQRTLPVKVLLVSLDAPSDRLAKVEPFIKRRSFVSEVLLLNEPKPHTWIDRVDPDWSGAIPCTIIVNTGRAKRSFFEREFTQQELQTTVNTFLRSIP